MLYGNDEDSDGDVVMPNNAEDLAKMFPNLDLGLGLDEDSKVKKPTEYTEDEPINALGEETQDLTDLADTDPMKLNFEFMN